MMWQDLFGNADKILIASYSVARAATNELVLDQARVVHGFSRNLWYVIVKISANSRISRQIMWLYRSLVALMHL